MVEHRELEPGGRDERQRIDPDVDAAPARSPRPGRSGAPPARARRGSRARPAGPGAARARTSPGCRAPASARPARARGAAPRRSRAGRERATGSSSRPAPVRPTVRCDRSTNRVRRSPPDRRSMRLARMARARVARRPARGAGRRRPRRRHEVSELDRGHRAVTQCEDCGGANSALQRDFTGVNTADRARGLTDNVFLTIAAAGLSARDPWLARRPGGWLASLHDARAGTAAVDDGRGLRPGLRRPRAGALPAPAHRPAADVALPAALPAALRARLRRDDPGARRRLGLPGRRDGQRHRLLLRGLRALAPGGRRLAQRPRVACVGVRLAVQLYTLREKLSEDLEGTLAALAATGVREVELAGLYDRGSAGMRAALDAAGLIAVLGARAARALRDRARAACSRRRGC